jgi:predicted PurR-regulated permease PerM
MKELVSGGGILLSGNLMMAGFPRSTTRRSNDFVIAERTIARGITIIAVLGIIAALYFGRALFIPLAVAILLTFVLAPLARFLQGLRLGRAPSVIIVVAFAFTAFFGLGTVLGQQVTQVVERLPLYEYNVQQKIRTVRDSAAQGQTLQRVTEFLRSLSRQLEPKEPTRAPAAVEEPKPVPVEIHQPPATPLQIISRLFDPLVEPLTASVIVIIFVIFFLLQREDLRDRLIRLAGSHDLKRTTEAINDAAGRLSRYFLAQTALNTAFGLIIGLGLWIVGLPNPVLWGMMAAILRFIPYLGAFMAAALPIMLSIAVDPGWTVTLGTVALFVVVEPLISQLVEPLVYGRSTGLSPVAVVVAATFWTWLWGPIGLLLSTPLAVCLGVLGRHISWLQFLDVMIGDEPPLSPAQSFYQRALAGDFNEAVAQAERHLKRKPLIRYYDDVVLQALMLAQIDVRRGTLDEAHIARINELIHSLVLDLADHVDEPSRGNGTADGEDKTPGIASLPVLAPRDLVAGWSDGEILCVAGPGPFDDATATMLVQLLRKHGLAARSESDRAISALNIANVDGKQVRLVCFADLYLGHSLIHLGYSIRRVRRKIPGARLLACLWCHEQVERVTDELQREMNKGAVPDLIAASLHEAVSQCIALATSEDEEERRVVSPSTQPETSAA